jgi:hypothetical protein
LCAACSDPDVGTRVRFQGGRPSTAWNVHATGDASVDAALDGGERIAAKASAVDAGRADEDAGAAPDASSSETKHLTACTFRLTTRSQGGRYAPKNVGAIWIERDDGTWVKTLAQWAGVRLRYLTTYLKANTTRSTVDAMTSATLRQHEKHEVKWNLRDGEGKTAPDGDYNVRVEVTDRAGTGQLLNVPFSKSGEALEISVEDSEYFVDVELRCS